MRKRLSGQIAREVAIEQTPLHLVDVGTQFGSPFTTPPRSVHCNPRSLFQEDVSLLPSIGSTPTKGRPKFPKHKNAGSIQKEKRESKCFEVPHAMCKWNNKKKEYESVRRTCQLCNSKTKFQCIVCKRWYCVVVNRDNISRKLICEQHPRVAHLGGTRPVPILTLQSASMRQGAHSQLVVQNSCFHIDHQKRRNKMVRALHTKSRKPTKRAQNSKSTAAL